VRRHGFDLLADFINGRCGARVGGIEGAHRVHQFLNRHGGMVDLTLRHQVVQHTRRSILHLIDVDAGVEQKRLTAHPARRDKRKFAVAAPRTGPLRVESRPTPRRIEVERGHLASQLFILPRCAGVKVVG
jgi:hypothetical protein